MDVARQQRVRIALLSTCALATPPKRYGGTELVVAELARGLVELGHRVTVYTTGDSAAAGELRHCFATPVWPPDELAELRHARFAWQDMASDPDRYDVPAIRRTLDDPSLPAKCHAFVASTHGAERTLQVLTQP